jgi:acid phosphatase type 7
MTVPFGRLLGAVLLLATVACDGGGTSGEVEPPVVGGGSLTIAAAGDVCEQGGVENGCAETADLVAQKDPDIVLALGDQQYESGDLEDFEGYYDANWGRFKARTLPTPGNHDKYGRSGYEEYFDKPQYYIADLGSWSVLSVDSNEPSESAEFIRTRLPIDDDVIVIWHHARYSPGSDHGSDSDIDELWEAARTGHACIVMYAHDHIYERGVTEGLPWFLVGTGGGEQHDDFIDSERVSGSDATVEQELGVLFMTLGSDGDYSFRFKNTDGEVLDRGRNACSS